MLIFKNREKQETVCGSTEKQAAAENVPKDQRKKLKEKERYEGRAILIAEKKSTMTKRRTLSN